ENFFLFGLTADQVADSRGWYDPRWHYDNQPEVREALDLIFSDFFSANERGVFAPLRDTLLTHGDHCTSPTSRRISRPTPGCARSTRTAAPGRARRFSTSPAPASSRAIARSPSTRPISGT